MKTYRELVLENESLNEGKITPKKGDKVRIIQKDKNIEADYGPFVKMDSKEIVIKSEEEGGRQ